MYLYITISYLAYISIFEVSSEIMAVKNMGVFFHPFRFHIDNIAFAPIFVTL